MDRCMICDRTTFDNPKLKVSCIEVTVTSEDKNTLVYEEFRCEVCHSQVQENVEDLSIAEDEFEFQAVNV